MSSAQDALPTPSSTSFDLDSKRRHGDECYQRRLRHLISIQIRNLTPFPVRDTFASALAQPATHSQFTPLGNLSDDLDVTLLRKRSRRVSATSVNIVKNTSADDDEARVNGEGRGRRRTSSRMSFPGGGNMGPTSGSGNALNRSLVANASTKQARVRTISAVSSRGLSASFSSTTSANSASNIPVSKLYFDHSQRTLEKVVRSRLVETFIAIFIPEPPPTSPSSSSVNGKSRSRADSGPSPSQAVSATPPNASMQATRRGARASRSASMGTGKMLITSTTSRLSTSKTKSPPVARQVSASSSAVKTHRVASSAPMQKSLSHQSPLFSPAGAPVFPKVPNYISPIHRPSTNPLYILDASSQCDFSEHTNLSTDRLKLQLWAKVDPNALQLGNIKGKQKDNDDGGSTSESPRWKVLEEWTFSFSDLIPLPPEQEHHLSQLPSNTLVMTFLPTGESFHLPPPAWSSSRSQSRSPSPSGYNTDPELEGRRLVQSTESVPSVSHDIIRSGQPLLSVFRRSRRLDARTSNLEELSELAALQARIRDTEGSLRDVIREIDLCLANDHVLISVRPSCTRQQRREISERQAHVEDRQAEVRAITEGSNRLRDDLATRRTQVRTRRERLAKAKELQAQGLAASSGQIARVTEERYNLVAIRNRIPLIRTSLISVLATIYPIELLSSSELLFTILAVPLPIPIGSNDPAPPLSLSSHREVTEDSVATALGYAAHLVQLLSVYMGKGLVYPITYIGSRSLIRDNISAMFGPRMFPLFSRGVDTYRFEYAVFLLNKDIEMLMADRDLRALDMRHTLANLKNLLLTLTDGECASARNSRCQDSPSTVGLATPPSPVSTNLASETPKAGRSPCLATSELPEESGSSATTPKGGQDEGSTNALSRYSKLSLGFPPLPGFFRSLNSPSILQASAKSARGTAEEGDAFVDVTTDTLEDAGTGHAGKPEDDDDRGTIKGVVVDTDEQSTRPQRKGEDTEEKMSGPTALTVVSVESFV